MDRFMERRLVGLHEAGTAARLKEKITAALVAILIIFLLPFLHLGVFYRIWHGAKPDVNMDKCSCDCFDTVFRGRYEWPPSAYKHVYFNATHQTLKIWLVTILGVVGLYESLCYLIQLVKPWQLRTQMLVLYLSSIYPHYYGWWGFFNYLNEDYYSQWWHQVFFSTTEMISTIIVVHLCNKASKMEPWKLLLVFNVNFMHIVVASLDQFIDNLILGKGQQFEAVRDLGLLAPDCLHVLVCYFEMRLLAEKRRVRLWNLFFKEELMMSVVLIILFSLFGKMM